MQVPVHRLVFGQTDLNQIPLSHLMDPESFLKIAELAYSQYFTPFAHWPRSLAASFFLLVKSWQLATTASAGESDIFSSSLLVALFYTPDCTPFQLFTLAFHPTHLPKCS